MLPLAFYILNLPSAARGYESIRESVQQRIEAHTGVLFILAFFVFGFCTFFARPIIDHVYGGPFLEASVVLRILMLAFLVHSAEMVLGMSCQAAGYHKFAFHVSSLRALSNIVFNNTESIIYRKAKRFFCHTKNRSLSTTLPRRHCLSSA